MGLLYKKSSKCVRQVTPVFIEIEYFLRGTQFFFWAVNFTAPTNGTYPSFTATLFPFNTISFTISCRYSLLNGCDVSRSFSHSTAQNEATSFLSIESTTACGECS